MIGSPIVQVCITTNLFFKTYSGPAEKLKKSRAKKLVKSNKSISQKNVVDQNTFFAISKMAKNQF